MHTARLAWSVMTSLVSVLAIGFAPTHAESDCRNWDDPPVITDGVCGSTDEPLFQWTGVGHYSGSASWIAFEPDANNSVNCWYITARGFNDSGAGWHLVEQLRYPSPTYAGVCTGAEDSDIETGVGLTYKVGGYTNGQYTCLTGGNTCYGVAFHSFKRGNGDPSEERYWYTSESNNALNYSSWECWELTYPGC